MQLKPLANIHQHTILQIAFRLAGVFYFIRALEFTPEGIQTILAGIVTVEPKSIIFPLIGFTWHYGIAIWLLKGAPHLLRRIIPTHELAA